MLRNMTLIGLILLTPVAASAEELTKTKREAIQSLLEVTGALTLGAQVAKAVTKDLTESIRKSRPNTPPEVFKALGQEIDRMVRNLFGPKSEFATELVQIYHRHFTLADIKGLLEFYRTPLGQKTIRVLPQAMQESMAAGRQVAQAHMPELIRRVKARVQGTLPAVPTEENGQ